MADKFKVTVIKGPQLERCRQNAYGYINKIVRDKLDRGEIPVDQLGEQKGAK